MEETHLCEEMEETHPLGWNMQFIIGAPEITDQNALEYFSEFFLQPMNLFPASFSFSSPTRRLKI